MHATDSQMDPVESGRDTAEHDPRGDARRAAPTSTSPAGQRRTRWIENVERFAERIIEDEGEFDRVLATVLFTDIVDSTAQSAAMGDRAWNEGACAARPGRASEPRAVPRSGDQDDGRWVPRDVRRTGTRRAVAEAIVAAQWRPLGIEIRAGLHTGEVALEDDDVAGLGVAIGARVGAKAQEPREVLVSQTVKDLVAGTGLSFEDAGEHELKGVPDRWHLYRVLT